MYQSKQLIVRDPTISINHGTIAIVIAFTYLNIVTLHSVLFISEGIVATESTILSVCELNLSHLYWSCHWWRWWWEQTLWCHHAPTFSDHIESDVHLIIMIHSCNNNGNSIIKWLHNGCIYCKIRHGRARALQCPKHFVVKGLKVIMCWVNVVLGRLKIYLGIYKIIEDIARYPTDSVCT